MRGMRRLRGQIREHRTASVITAVIGAVGIVHGQVVAGIIFLGIGVWLLLRAS